MIDERIARRKQAQARASESEVTADEWAKIAATKLTDDQRAKLTQLKTAMDAGKVRRKTEHKYTKTGKHSPFSKTEALEYADELAESLEQERRAERLRETIRTKPANYHVITRDEDLPRLVDRLREEVERQQHDEWFRKVFGLFNNTLIRAKLTERGIDLPLVVSFTEWDTETTGTDTYIDKQGGYSFWLPLLNEGYYVAFGHLTDDPQCSRSKALNTVRDFIEDAKHAKSFHNTPFDLAMFRNDGLDPKGFRYDSLDAMRHLNEHEESMALKPIFTKYKPMLGGDHLDDYTFEDLFGNGTPLIYQPEPVGIYAIKDVEKGWLVTRWQIEMMLAKDDLYKSYFEIRQYLYEVDTTIERTGFRVNLEKMSALESEFAPKLEQAKRDLFEAYNIDEDFLYTMSMHLKGDKIKAWVAAQEKRIEKQAEMLAKCEADIKTANPTTKKYTQLQERIDRYRANPLPEAIPQNAPDFITEFNLSSNDHLAYLIYDYLGIKDRTKEVEKRGERKVSKKVLELYFAQESSLKPLEAVSIYEKLLGTYVEKIPKALEHDGRLHTQLDTVSTGRYSSKGYKGKPIEYFKHHSEITDENFIEHMRELADAPNASVKKGTNLQNIPSRTEAGTRVRMTIEPPKGYTFIGSDLSSIEPRIQAHRMEVEFGDSSFAEMYRQGLDPYVEFAAILFKVPKEHATEKYYKSVKGTPDEVPAYRKAMKQMFLAIGYGQAFDMFYAGVIPFGIGEQQAREAYNKFDEILPGFKTMVNATFDHLRKHGWAATIFGQKRRFPGYVDKYKRLCVLMRKAGIRDKNDPMLGKKTNKLKWQDRSEFWELMRFTGGCERAAFNHTIQGSGANILQLCMIRSYYEMTLERGWEFSLTLHDEQKHAIPNEQLTPEAIALYDDVMTNTYRLVLPLACDTVIEPRWMEEYGPDDWDFENNRPKGDD